MASKCIHCGSENVVKLIPVGSLIIPELKQEVVDGLAEIDYCGCKSGVTGSKTKCKDCGFVWDSLIERQIRAQQEEDAR